MPVARRTRAYRPDPSPELRRRVEAHLRALGTLRAAYVVLAIFRWLQEREGYEAVTGRDARALYPRAASGIAGPCGSLPETLRRLRTMGLTASLADGWQRVTPLGCAVVAALPDAERVRALLGARTAARILRQSP